MLPEKQKIICPSGAIMNHKPYNLELLQWHQGKLVIAPSTFVNIYKHNNKNSIMGNCMNTFHRAVAGCTCTFSLRECNATWLQAHTLQISVERMSSCWQRDMDQHANAAERDGHRSQNPQEHTLCTQQTVQQVATERRGGSTPIQSFEK